MYYLSDDPSYMLIALGFAAACCLIALRVTQQGKFMVWAGTLAAVALAIFGVEQYWVTDAERVERVVYDLARAVEASDVERIKSHLDEHVTAGMSGKLIDASIPLRIVLPMLSRTRFDFVRIGQLSTTAGSQTKMGTATFKVTASGTFNEGGSEIPLGSLGTEWALGFREESPGVWKVTRITAIKIPPQVARALFGR